MAKSKNFNQLLQNILNNIDHYSCIIDKRDPQQPSISFYELLQTDKLITSPYFFIKHINFYILFTIANLSFMNPVHPDHHIFILQKKVKFQHLDQMLVHFIAIFADRIDQFLIKLHYFHLYFFVLAEQYPLINIDLILFKYCKRFIIYLEVLLMNIRNIHTFYLFTYNIIFMFMDDLLSIQVIDLKYRSKQLIFAKLPALVKH